jgi:putative ABC transport system permease protein
MRWAFSWFARLRARYKYRHFDRDLQEELVVHEARAREDLVKQGFDPSDAERRARLQVGNITLAREGARGVWLPVWIDGVRTEIRVGLGHSFRRLVRAPWRTAAIAGTLSLAVGIGTAMFVVADGLLLRPVPFPKAEELALISLRTPVMSGSMSVEPVMFEAWKRTDAFRGIEAASTEMCVVEADGGEAVLGVARISPGLLTLLGGVHPTTGRLLGPADDDREVLISATVWRTLYGNDPGIVGRSIRVDGESVQVVGVLPATFLFPNRSTVIWRATDFRSPHDALFRPMVYVRIPTDGHRSRALDVATAAARSMDSRYSERWRVEAEPLAEYLSDRFQRRAVPLLIAAVALLLLMLTTNAAGLMFLAVSARRREMAIRRALGASRWRLLFDSLSETLLLCTGGIAGGLIISGWLVALCRRMLDSAALMRGLRVLELDGRAVGAAILLGLVISLSVGISAWLAAALGGAKNARYLRTAGDIGRERAWSTRGRLLLVVGQVSLSFLLAFTSLLLVRSFLSLAIINPGFDPKTMVVAWIVFPSSDFPTEAKRAEAVNKLRANAEAISGIRVATWSYGTPPGGGITDTGAWQAVDGGVSRVMSAHRLYVEPEFFEAYGLRVLAGRPLAGTDDPNAIVISERLAAALWPDGPAVGRRLLFEGVEKNVVGVVTEVRYPSLGELKDLPQYYLRMVTPGSTPMLTMACVGPCPNDAVIRRHLTATDRRIRIQSLYTPEAVYQRELAGPAAMAAFGSVIAAVALCAGAAGLFSVLAQFVADRRREFAVRACLGASRAALRMLVWRQAVSVVVPGLLVGCLAGKWSSGRLAGLMVNSTPGVALWLSLSLVVALVVVVAAWVPLRAATRIAPIELLRE